MTGFKTILYVEDDKDACELIQFVLEQEGFRVVSCETSEEGLGLAKKGNFSAIVLDHRLADISGLEICRQIRIYDKRTPIVFYTAAAYPKDRKAGLAAGANAYLVKPNDFERIAETIKRLISETPSFEYRTACC
jgi:DNA-binding response OmpR family regulator